MSARRIRSCIALILALLPCFARPSAADSYWVRPSPHGQNYSDVQCFPGGIAWTAADGGRVARSNDYGATWTLIPQFKPVDLPLTAVAFASPTRGLVTTKQFAGGSTAGKVLLTWDGGLTWTTKQLIPSGNVIDADWADSLNALVLISSGLMARSTDGGLTWTLFTPPATGTVNHLRHVAGSTWFYAGVTGLYRSIDNGTTWTSVKSGAYTNVLFFDANNGIAVGSGAIVRTTDGGTNWTIATGTVGGSNFGIAYATSSIVAVTTFTGQVVRSVDGGSTWTNATMTAVFSFPSWAVSFFDASRGLAVGSYGQIVSTTNGGASWSTNTLRLDQDTGQVDVVYDIARTGSQTWFAAASSGLYITTDEGATFTRLKLGSYTSVSFRDALTGIAIGGIGSSIWRTIDGGATWTGSNPPKPAVLSTVSFGPGGIGLIGSDHYVFRSTDGGASWTDIYLNVCGNCPMYNIGWADANNVFVAGSPFLRSTNAGASFASVASPTSARDVSFATPLVGTIIGGVSTTFSRTVDGGATWTAPPVQTAYSPPPGLRRLAMSDIYTAWAVGDSGVVMHTINGGGTWTRTPSTTTVPLYALRVLDDSTAVIGGGLGGAAIVLTAHPPAQPVVWNLGATGSGATLYDVAFGDANVGFICAANSSPLRTTDGGANWSPVAVGGPGTTLLGATFVDPTNAICVGSGGVVYRSTNAGLNWSPVPSGTSSQLRVVAFASASVGCAVGASGTIIRTVDGGATWNPVTNPAPYATMYGVAFGDALTGVCVGYGTNPGTGLTGGVIERTTDGGATWAIVSTTTAFTIDVAFASPSVAVVVAASGGFYATRSSDGGATWTVVPAEATAQGYFGVGFVSATEGYAVGWGGTVARTTDGGLSWLFEPTEILPLPLAMTPDRGDPAIDSYLPLPDVILTSADLYSVASRAGQGVVVVGAAGTALRRDTQVTAVEDPPARGLSMLALAPIAPNPTRHSAMIDFALGAAARVRVRIFDVTGAEVASLADGVFTAGRHVLRWNTQDAASGVYFVHVEVGNRSESRKFVVLR